MTNLSRTRGNSGFSAVAKPTKNLWPPRPELGLIVARPSASQLSASQFEAPDRMIWTGRANLSDEPPDVWRQAFREVSTRRVAPVQR